MAKRRTKGQTPQWPKEGQKDRQLNGQKKDKRTNTSMAKRRTKGQTPQWPKEEGQKDNQRSTKHHIVTRIPIKKTGVNFPLSFLQLSKRVSRNITIPGFLEATSINRDFKF